MLDPIEWDDGLALEELEELELILEVIVAATLAALLTPFVPATSTVLPCPFVVSWYVVPDTVKAGPPTLSVLDGPNVNCVNELAVKVLSPTVIMMAPAVACCGEDVACAVIGIVDVPMMRF